MTTAGVPTARNRRRVIAVPVLVLLALTTSVLPAGAATGSWHQVAAPSPGTLATDLTSVSCPTATTCYAVGSKVDNGGHLRPVIEKTTDGVTWVEQAALEREPILDGYPAYLNGISCTSETRCFAVGAVDWPGGTWALLMSTSDGSTWYWTNGSHPNPGDGRTTRLDAVSCRGDLSCTAVGVETYRLGSPDGFFRSLIMRTKNGNTMFTAPVSVQGGWFKGISCVTTDRCVAVGVGYPTGMPGPVMLVARKSNPSASGWDLTSPQLGWIRNKELLGVSCTTWTRCVAVGRRGEGSLVLSTTDGTTWSPQPSHAPKYTKLTSVSCRGERCTAVGFRPRPSPLAAAPPGVLDTPAAVRTTDGTTWSAMTVPVIATGGAAKASRVRSAGPAPRPASAAPGP